MGRAIDFLEAHQSSTPSHWRRDAQWRRDNEYWLKYSRYITLHVLQAMDDQSVTQVELAKRMGCTQQYVSNLLRGGSNMTLETIARLENALGIDILKSALSFAGVHDVTSGSSRHYLSDSGGCEPGCDIKTRDCVDGYK